jgi:hypothetical protein
MEKLPLRRVSLVHPSHTEQPRKLFPQDLFHHAHLLRYSWVQCGQCTKENGYCLSWQQTTWSSKWFWFCGYTECKSMVSWRLLHECQRKAWKARCVTGSGSLKSAPEKVVSEAVRVKAKMHWRLPIRGSPMLEVLGTWNICQGKPQAY